MPDSVLIPMRTTDAFVHAWHLAKATGSPPTWTVPATPLLASLCQHMTGGLRGVYFGDRNLVIGTGRLSATAQIVAICAPQLLSASGPLAAQIGGSVRVLFDHSCHSACC